MGNDDYFDAWLYNFMIENNIAYHMNPQITASIEQISFMVALEKNEVYIPCNDHTFQMLLHGKDQAVLNQAYRRVWSTIVNIVRSVGFTQQEKRRVLTFCRFRFKELVHNRNIIPSRVMKRMTSLLAAQSGIEDPWSKLRQQANINDLEVFNSDIIQNALYEMDQSISKATNLFTLRVELNRLELARLMYLSANSRGIANNTRSTKQLQQAFTESSSLAKDFLSLLEVESDNCKTILFLPDTSGGFVFDMALITRLRSMGHKVIVALKNNFYFYSPTIDDAQDDSVIEKLLEDAIIVQDSSLSKNQLIQYLRLSSLVIIDDGTRERLNLYRTNITFARAWKEADIILAKGLRNAQLLALNSQNFTRDIACYWVDSDNTYQLKTKLRAKHIRKLTEGDIRERAEGIIAQMRHAHKSGKTIMFYSCIIGSIPEQESTAIALVNAFVENLRNKLDDTFIINPAEQSPNGMDGDDLMYMWERVQRSGYINVWRFQTVQDIEDSFAMLGKKVLPAWAGKDATYSTGCTKEMRIALDVQKHNPEMQILGPSKKKFFRRDTYGVGKYFDSRI